MLTTQRQNSNQESWVSKTQRSTHAKSKLKMLICFFDQEGIIHRQFVPRGIWPMQTSTVMLYGYVKMCGERGHRNGKTRTSLHTTRMLRLTGPLKFRSFWPRTWVVPHPLYSPDLRRDFFLFPKLKLRMKGRRFDTTGDSRRIAAGTWQNSKKGLPGKLPSMAEKLGPLYSCKRGVLWRWWKNLTSKGKQTSFYKYCPGTFGYTPVVNAHRITEEPLNLFFVDLEPAANKDVYNIPTLKNIQIEPPRVNKTNVVQCARCQQYGHTKTYCNKHLCASNVAAYTTAKTAPSVKICRLNAHYVEEITQQIIKAVRTNKIAHRTRKDKPDGLPTKTTTARLRKKRTWKKNITKFATWNILSWSGRNHEILTELHNLRIDFCAISETKKKGKGTVFIDDYILAYSGKQKESPSRCRATDSHKVYEHR